MKCLCASVLLIAVCSSSLYAQGAGVPSREDATLKDQLFERVDAFMHAWEKQDQAALTSTMAPEFLYVTSRGVSPRERERASLVRLPTHVRLRATV